MNGAAGPRQTPGSGGASPAAVRPLPAGVRLLPAGDGALVVEFGDRVNRAVHRRVLGLWQDLNRRPLPGVVDVVPTYRSVLVVWDPERASAEEVQAEVVRRLESAGGRAFRRRRTVVVPVVYGGPMGPDLPAVAAHTGLEPDEVVRLHSARRYMVYMLGFTPGFAYLGPLDRRLWTPRRATPRLRVPAGSVGIGGSQTGIYSIDDTPGGWQLIGRTWLSLWDAARRPPALLRPGDRVRFEPVSLAEAPREWVETALESRWQLESA